MTLLKPFAEDRYYTAPDRARTQLQAYEPGGDERMEALQAFPRNAKTSAYPEVFAIQAGERHQIVRIQEIRCIETTGSYVRLHLPQAAD